jgi:restriction system protein
MSRYWHKRRKYNSGRPDDIIFLLLFVLILSIFYPPIRPVIYSVWYIYVFAVLIIVAMIGYKIYHYQKLSKAGIFEIDKMNGTDFEIFLTSLFSKLGYKVQHVGRIGDYGADLIIEMNGLRIAVQAKRYKDNVGPDAVREVNTVIKPRNCSQGMVVTNSFYTQEAIFLAKSNNITLWNRNDLVNNILKTQKS